MLLVEEGFRYPARVDSSGMKLVSADDLTAIDVIDLLREWEMRQ